jgi:hypothetical protein
VYVIRFGSPTVTCSDTERKQLYPGSRTDASSCIYITDLSFQRPSLRMLPYLSNRQNQLTLCILLLQPLQALVISAQMQLPADWNLYHLHCTTAELYRELTLTWHANLNLESQNSVLSNLTGNCINKHNKVPCVYFKRQSDLIPTYYCVQESTPYVYINTYICNKLKYQDINVEHKRPAKKVRIKTIILCSKGPICWVKLLAALSYGTMTRRRLFACFIVKVIHFSPVIFL